MTASDEIVKGAMAGYVFEHFEIASYTALIAAAKTAGDAETVRVCEEILVQEEAMADWLATHLPEVTEEFMVRDATLALKQRSEPLSLVGWVHARPTGPGLQRKALG